MIRFIYLLGSLLKFAMLLLARNIGLYKSSDPRFLRDFFEDAGGSFIKFGQLLALRVDVLPDEYSEEMLDLLDNVAPFSYQEVREVFLKEIGVPPEEVFKHFEKEPFAAASFGQVHGAKLKNGSVVVVKVMRPGIESDIEIDFVFIQLLALLGDIFYKIKAFKWREFADEFIRWTREEVDYLLEAEKAERMYQNTRGSPTIVVPETNHNLTTRRILVQEYIEGFPLSRIMKGLKDGRLSKEGLQKMGVDIEKIPHIMVTELIRQCFVDKFFHADPHPGNIIILPGNKVGFIDFGIMGESNFHNESSFIHYMECVGRKDFENGVFYFADFSAGDLKQMLFSAFPVTITDIEMQELTSELSKHFAKTVMKIVGGRVEDLHQMKTDYTTLLFEILKAGDHFKIKIPKEATLFIRVLGVAGILGKQLNINFLLTQEIKQFFESHPIDSLIRDPLSTNLFKRLSREKALEKLSACVTMLYERDPGAYKVVNDYLSRYN